MNGSNKVFDAGCLPGVQCAAWYKQTSWRFHGVHDGLRSQNDTSYIEDEKVHARRRLELVLTDTRCLRVVHCPRQWIDGGHFVGSEGSKDTRREEMSSSIKVATVAL